VAREYSSLHLTFALDEVHNVSEAQGWLTNEALTESGLQRRRWRGGAAVKRDARRRIATRMEPRQLPQVGMDLDPRAIPAPLAKIPINGLITNDKFCLRRYGRLALTWPRAHPLPRAWRQAPSVYAPPDDAHRHRRGGRYASPTRAALAPAPSAGSSPRRTAALGSRLPAPRAVDARLSADSAQARTGGQP
jgi:hypothetical protein